MFVTGADEVDAGGFDGTVAEDVGQAHDVFADLVIGGGEEMAQIMRKDFAGQDAGAGTQGFHFFPYLFS